MKDVAFFEFTYTIFVVLLSVSGLLLFLVPRDNETDMKYAIGEILWIVHGLMTLWVLLVIWVPNGEFFGLFVLLTFAHMGFVVAGAIGLLACLVIKLIGRRVQPWNAVGFATVLLMSGWLLYLVFRSGPVFI